MAETQSKEVEDNDAIECSFLVKRCAIEPHSSVVAVSLLKLT